MIHGRVTLFVVAVEEVENDVRVEVLHDGKEPLVRLRILGSEPEGLVSHLCGRNPPIPQ